MQLLILEFSADYYTRPAGIISLLMLTITYRQSLYIYIYIYINTQVRFNNHATRSLYRIMVMATSVMGVIKMGNTVPRGGLGPTSLAFRASGLPLHHIGSLILPLCYVYAAPCLRGQCRLLQCNHYKQALYQAVQCNLYKQILSYAV